MPTQQVGPLETGSALAADVRTEIEVNLLVRVPSTCLSKRFAADTARVRPLAGVRSHVLGEVRSACTSTSTDAANEWLIFAGVVLTHVLIEVLHFPVLSIAPGARVPLRPVRRVLVKR